MIKDRKKRLEEREKRMQITYRIGDIQDTHCEGCEYNKSTEKDYCNNKCNFGKELLKLGTLLGSKNDPRNKPSKEEYLMYKSEGLRDIEITKKYGWAPSTIKNWKREWGLSHNKKEEVRVIETKDPKVIKSAEIEMTKEEFKRLYTEGFKKQEIAEKMGITPMKMSNLVNNKWGLNGWKPDRNRGIVVGYDLREVEPVNQTNDHKDHERAIKDLQNELSDEKLKSKRLAEKLEECDGAIARLKDSNEKLRNTVERNVYEYKELEKSRDQLKNQIKEATPQKETVQSLEAYNKLEIQLDESFKRFDELEEKYDTVCTTLKMLL